MRFAVHRETIEKPNGTFFKKSCVIKILLTLRGHPPARLP
jgi:hypothetical protein